MDKFEKAPFFSAEKRTTKEGFRGRKYLLFTLIGFSAGIFIGGLGCLYQFWPQTFAYFNGLGLHGNIERLRAVILSFGFWAPVISALLMVGQSVILFLPAFPIFVVNALSFGVLWGTLLSWSSAVLGSLICFSIAKKLGRPAVQRFVNRIHLEAADAALRRYEKYIILPFGFLPVISFDVISYASGLTLLTFWEFLPLVCLAQIPSTLFYSVLVDKIDRGTLDVYWVVGAGLFLLLGAASPLFRMILTRHRREGERPRQTDPEGTGIVRRNVVTPTKRNPIA
jgi:uncharacterized membrane protein YdjX (TVP38/TMEM64 family)